MKLNIRCFAAIPVLLLSCAVAEVGESYVETFYEAASAPVTWWRSDVDPWRSVQNPSTNNCTLLLSIREPLAPRSCPSRPACLPVVSCALVPSCQAPAPVIPSIDAAKCWPTSDQEEKDAKDAENIHNFCSRMQRYIPLIRPNDTYSIYVNLQQKGWKDSPFIDTKILVKILHQTNKSFLKELTQNLCTLQSISTFGLSNLLHGRAHGKRSSDICDRTDLEQTRFEAYIESVQGLWSMEAKDRGGYKVLPKDCTLYDWEPVWPANGWPSEDFKLG